MRLFLLSVLLAGCVPVRSGLTYEAQGRAVDAVTGAPVVGAVARLVGVRLGLPVSVFAQRYSYPRTCARLAIADSAIAASPGDLDVWTRVLRADTTASDGRFSVSIRRGWGAGPLGTDRYRLQDYDWRWLEVRRDGYAPFRTPISEHCPETLVAPDLIPLTPLR